MKPAVAATSIETGIPLDFSLGSRDVDLQQSGRELGWKVSLALQSSPKHLSPRDANQSIYIRPQK